MLPAPPRPDDWKWAVIVFVRLCEVVCCLWYEIAKVEWFGQSFDDTRDDRALCTVSDVEEPWGPDGLLYLCS